jgi:multidrug resistance efflux pump
MVSTSPSSSPSVRAVPEPVKSAAAVSPLEIVLELIRRARSAENLPALQFIAVNDSHLLAPFQQSVLWLKAGGVTALSGLTEVETNAPYVHWLARALGSLPAGKTRPISAPDLPLEIQAQWGEWLPAHALWVPFGTSREQVGGLLLVRDLPWREVEGRLFHEWMQTWFCAYRALSKPGILSASWGAVLKTPRRVLTKPILAICTIFAILLFPVRISVLTPGELVPANPVTIRAPFDGVIKDIFVSTNEAVKADQPLFAYDDAQLLSKLDVATETLRTATVEQRQFSQQALNDAKARAALSSARGNVEEKRLEAEFLRGQLERSKVLAPQDGIAFVDDPSAWAGRSVSAGQHIMRLAEPRDMEIEAWLPVSDAIELPERAPARLYLSASPMAPVSAEVRYIAYEATRRPDGQYAYRVRATLDGASEHRVGLKGTVRLTGGRVPLAFWALRRPLAAMREFFGL